MKISCKKGQFVQLLESSGNRASLVMCSHLIRVESPEVEFLLEQRSAHVGRVVQLAGPVVVEYLREDARMAVEEVLVEYRVVVGKGLGQPRQPRRRDLLQGGLVRLVPDATHVDDDTVVSVGHDLPATGCRRRIYKFVGPEPYFLSAVTFCCLATPFYGCRRKISFDELRCDSNALRTVFVIRFAETSYTTCYFSECVGL